MAPFLSFALIFALLFSPFRTVAAELPAGPFLRIAPGMHTAPINRMAMDRDGRFLVTASDDKTAKIWESTTGRLVRTLRPFQAKGKEGKLYCTAMSPDGKQVALGGWTEAGRSLYNIYIFDRKYGRLVHRISGLPGVILHLAWSKDGAFLAAALGRSNGVRIYETDRFTETASDPDYGDGSYWVDFDAKGRMVTTCLDGYIRLYHKNFTCFAKQKVSGGKRPFGAAFHPKGDRIAVGFNDTPLVNLYSASDLSFISAPDTSRFCNGDLSKVVWSGDGNTLYAGGQYHDNGDCPIIAWPHGGKGKPFQLQAGKNTLMALLPLNDGSLFFASQDPALGRLDSQGRISWRNLPPIVDFRSQQTKFEVSVTGTGIAAGFDILDDRNQYHYHRVQLDVSTMAMTVDPGTGTALAQVQMALKDAGYDPGPIDGAMGEQTRAATLRFQQDNHLAVDGKPGSELYTALGVETLSPARTSAPGLAVAQWHYKYAPTLNQAPIELKDNEKSMSLAISSDGRKFMLGTAWYLRCYDTRGKLKWKKPSPSIACAVNISRDNSTAVALYGDGSLRWHDIETGEEKLAFFLSPDLTDWVLWTPQGFFNFGGSGDRLIGYHINQGADKEGEFVGADQLRHVFHRADLVSRALTPEGQKQLVAEAGRVGDVRKVLARGLPPHVALVNLPAGPWIPGILSLRWIFRTGEAASAGSCTRSTAAILKTRASPGRPAKGSARPYAENGPSPCPRER